MELCQKAHVVKTSSGSAVADMRRIQQYTAAHAELSEAHHWLFDCPLNKNTENVDVIVIGINPGERDRDWQLTKSWWAGPDNHPMAESRNYDFQQSWPGCNGRDSIPFTRICQELLSGISLDVTLSEFFFWSSHDAGKAFTGRFGSSIGEQQAHLEFCKALNMELITRHRPKMVVSPGLMMVSNGLKSKIESLYGLEHVETIKLDGGADRVVVHYKLPDGTPFIFTKHWTGARLSSLETSFIKEYLETLTVDKRPPLAFAAAQMVADAAVVLGHDGGGHQAVEEKVRAVLNATKNQAYATGHANGAGAAPFTAAQVN